MLGCGRFEQCQGQTLYDFLGLGRDCQNLLTKLGSPLRYASEPSELSTASDDCTEGLKYHGGLINNPV